ncbi:hypothetical protein KUV65_02530 [Maritalea mobilis]|uniref:hypothetical protein n=1 Tax=Maritalea mobilis TaxID=483324 RepID=UPI001C97A899|nr:hypothetical protein [Maritalea mobilis]MBY6200223.1 hypothetical protein [Maritalea mobilis]
MIGRLLTGLGVLVLLAWLYLTVIAWKVEDLEQLNRLGVLCIAAALVLFFRYRNIVDDQKRSITELELKLWVLQSTASSNSDRHQEAQAFTDRLTALRSSVEQSGRTVVLAEITLVVIGTIQTGAGDLIREWLN